MLSLLEKIAAAKSNSYYRTTFGLGFALWWACFFVYLISTLVVKTDGMFRSGQDTGPRTAMIDPIKAAARPAHGPDSRARYPEFTGQYHIEVQNLPDLISRLKEYDLWEIGKNKAVKPVVFDSFPDGLQESATKFRKRIFFNTLLPSILIVQQEIEGERREISGFLQKIGEDVSHFDFNEDIDAWQGRFTEEELRRIDTLKRKYRASQASRLLNRIDTIPASLILAQGAIESSWGSSRFSREGNNIFGIWTWRDHGLIPARRDENKNHKVAVYPSIMDSIRAYYLTLNRISAYSSFRRIRRETRDSLRLAEGLIKYSEKGAAYVKDLKDVIRFNKLKKYDTCYLQEGVIISAER